MPKEKNESSTSKTLKRKVNSTCKYCGKPAATSSPASSTASSKVSVPSPKRRKIINMTSYGNTSVRGDSAKWTSKAEYDFVDVMYDEVLKGNIYTTNFSTMVWSDMRTKLFERTGVMFTVKQMKGKHNRLKDLWKRYYELMLASTGIGWNAETNLPQAEPFIWEKLGEINKDFLELRYKAFPHYLKLDVVFSGRAATGAAARASTQRPVQLPEARTDTQDDSVDLMSPSASTPTYTNTRSTSSGRGKRKAIDEDVVVALVQQLNATTNVIAKNAEQEEDWSINRVIKVLETFELDDCTFNLALDHFQSKKHRRTFMALSTVKQQRSYLSYHIKT